jgi:inward rectifier potassium channel
MAPEKVICPDMGNRETSSDRNGSDIDLGAGKFISSQSRRRLLNWDGTFNVLRTGLGFFETVSVYHFILANSWPRFLGLAAVWYILANAAFAAAYVALGPEALDGLAATSPLVAFSQAFLFSVHMFATIGYGDVTPASWQADVLVTLESLVGLLSFGLAAGLMFACFAWPNAGIHDVLPAPSSRNRDP